MSAVSIQGQAEFLREIVSRTLMLGGALAGETHLTLTKEDAQKLEDVAARLERIAPYEADVRRLVTGR